ncbi:hypothetical protein K450DRAFT_234273 [Umbelopsis ramanniana AG]|uniref:Uncharacterized protein n=1 Tax=Umbelopsis ramanniana AG TaxID=1314678 RepID=A0AAD5HE53_UMBRA|nr:uncharacterized protein K450DRAFT_234273 [Umbelopsis ramanniana AG]KAI8581025.1 hypothetical protein K450DRAFT_234273 [Umbelopsis ramanniana AG]
MNRGPGSVYTIPGLKNLNSAKDCDECGKAFTFLRQKYHCKNCGCVVCGNCSENRYEIPKFGFNNPVRCCNTCHEMIKMQRMGTQALLNLPMKKLKFYLTAYQLPSRGALEKQDLVRIIMSSHPVSNASETHYRKMKALAPKPSRQDTSSQSENGSSFTGFVNGLMDGIGDIFRDDEEPSRRQDESRRRQPQQQQQYAPPLFHPSQAPRPPRPPQHHYTPPNNMSQPNNSYTPPQYRPPPAQNGHRPPTQTAPPPRQQPRPQQTQQRSTENVTPPRPPQSTSPVEFEPPSLDTIIQAKIDPSTLSVRTLKGILRANFVEHSKVLEKSELVTRVARLLEDRRKEMQRNDDRGLEDEGLCRICCDASQNCVFLECGHMVTCMDCGKKLVATRNECPICRERIIKIVHVFRS